MRTGLLIAVVLLGCGSSSSTGGAAGAQGGAGGSEGAGAGGAGASTGTGGAGGTETGAGGQGTAGAPGAGGSNAGSAGTASSAGGSDGGSAGTASSAGAGGGPGADTWVNFAEGFFATYCVECHGAGNTKRDYTTLAGVMKDAPLVRCGVAPTKLADCGPTAPAPKQFPISDATKTNPKPSDADRARIVAWIDAGTP